MANKCKSCGQEIKWIQTSGGKNMPCDPTIVMYWAKPKSKDKIVTQDGKVINCNLDGDPVKATGVGYVPHWATCPHADKFKR